jgi:hypothetical protein
LTPFLAGLRGVDVSVKASGGGSSLQQKPNRG